MASTAGVAITDLTADDDVVVNETFASTDTTFTHDAEGDQGGSLKGNLIDDGHFVYVYDAWRRLVKSAPLARLVRPGLPGDAVPSVSRHGTC